MLNKEQLEAAKNYRLSTNFTLYELIKSDRYPEFVEWPADHIIELLKDFAANTLQPIRDKFGSIRVNSGYRNPLLNRMVGGVKDSIHQIDMSGVILGCAADIVPPSTCDIMDVYWWIADNVKTARNVIVYRNRFVTNSPFIHIDTRRNVSGPIRTLEKTKSATYVAIDRSK